MKKLQVINTNINQIKPLISQEQLKFSENNKKFLNVQHVNSIFSQNRNFSTNFELVNGFVENNEILVLYKQWDVILYQNLEEKLNFILPFIRYEILYKEPEPNNITFYSSQDDLYTSYFYEIKEIENEDESLLFLHVSFCINKTFQGKLILPEAKLQIILQNPLVINQ